MSIKVTRIDVWAAEIQDRPGGLAEVLAELAGAGANLECLIARRKPEKPGTGAVFLTPLKGKKVQGAARTAGFLHAGRIATLKVEGADRPGIGQAICRAVGDAGISMRGLTAAVIARKFVAYLGFDTDQDAIAAARVLKALGRKKK